MRLEDSTIVCHSFAHSRAASGVAAGDVSFSLILLLALQLQPTPRSDQAAALFPKASV
jgi:hypothetical protein